MSSVLISPLLTLQDVNIDLVPQVDVDVRPVGVVEVAAVGPAVRHHGPLYKELGDGGGAGHHDGAHPSSGPGELDTLARRERIYHMNEERSQLTRVKGKISPQIPLL